MLWRWSSSSTETGEQQRLVRSQDLKLKHLAKCSGQLWFLKPKPTMWKPLKTRRVPSVGRRLRNKPDGKGSNPPVLDGLKGEKKNMKKTFFSHFGSQPDPCRTKAKLKYFSMFKQEFAMEPRNKQWNIVKFRTFVLEVSPLWVEFGLLRAHKHGRLAIRCSLQGSMGLLGETLFVGWGEVSGSGRFAVERAKLRPGENIEKSPVTEKRLLSQKQRARRRWPWKTKAFIPKNPAYEILWGANMSFRSVMIWGPQEEPLDQGAIWITSKTANNS